MADSYNIASYFPIYTGTGTGASGYIDAIKAKVTPYAVANGAYSTTSGGATSNTLGFSYWWLRSGNYYNYSLAYGVSHNGYVGDLTVSFSLGVRPSFILNLA